jgi:arylsulfatase A-like enzyme
VNAVAHVREERASVLDLLPTGLWFGGLLAVARTWLLAAPAAGRSADALTLERWAAFVRFPEVLAEGVLAGVAGALLLVVAADKGRHTLRVAGFAVSIFVAGAFLAGWPPPDGGRAVPGFGQEVALLAVGGALVAALLAHTGTLVRGKLALLTAALVAVVLPWLGSRLFADEAPKMERRLVIADVVASVDSWRVLEQRPGLPPVPKMLTPMIDQHADVADKPAIRMAPPCAVGFDVPPEIGRATLRAAAGADLEVLRRLPPELEGLTVDYSVELDGEVVWTERVTHAPMPLGVWAPERFAWRHAGGAEGIPVRAGQRIVLRTAFAPDQDLSKLSEEGLDLGFGGVYLERTVQRRRALASPDSPNIVLVVMDTQRVDRLGCYGYGRNVSPNLDALARRGTLFEQAYATSSWTWPATASILTGLPVDEHGVTEAAHCTLSHSLTTIAEALQARGYSTAAFSGNPLIVERRQFDQGFEHFDGSVPDFRMSDELVPGVLDWLRDHASARFFLYLHLVDPHTPHRPHPEEALRLGLGEPPADWPERGVQGIPTHPESMNFDVSPAMREYMQAEYDASVATGDRWFGAVLDELAALGLTDRTIVCFTADHGEGLLDHGLVGHGNSVYGEEVRVPLVVAGPGIPSNRRRTGVVSNRHIAPTLAELTGADLPVREPRSLFDDELPQSAVYGTRRGRLGKESNLVLHGLRERDHVLHWRERLGATGFLAPKDVPASDLWLFDVRSDPGENLNILTTDEPLARELLERLQERLRDAATHAPPLVPGGSAGALHTLKHIGYAGEND